MKKTLLITGFLIAVAASALLATMEDDLMQGKKTLLQKPIVKRTIMDMREQLPPRVEEAYVSDKGGGSLVEISAKVGKGEEPDTENEDTPPEKRAEIDGARLFYRAGGAWKFIDFSDSMSRPEVMDVVLSGGIGAGDDYSIRAWDTKGRVTVDISCETGQWPPKDSVWNNSCLKYSGGNQIEECLADAVPSGCIFPVGADEPPVDDMPSRAGQDLDMLGVFVARDRQKLYVAIGVQGVVNKGSLTPVSLYQYGFVVMNPRRIAAGSEDMIPHGGALVRYLPLGADNPGFAAMCSAVRNVDGALFEDTKSVSCESRGGVALISMDLDVVGKNAKELVIIAHTGILSGFKLEDFSFINMTSPVRILLGERMFDSGRAVVEEKQEPEGRKTGWE